MARPTKYTQNMPEKVRAYIKKCPDALPSIPGFACKIGVCESTIHNWEKEYPKFLVALRELHTAQHNTLLNKGLTGKYSATITKLILSSNHGYRERSETRDEPLPDDPMSMESIVERCKAVEDAGTGLDERSVGEA